jgi:16S rRNA (guanine527-N7)-methyltransferase
MAAPLRTLDAPRRPGMVTAIPAADSEAFFKTIADDVSDLGLGLTGEQIGLLRDYLDHLLHWNALINLSAVTAPNEMLTVHLIDSLAAIGPVAALAAARANQSVPTYAGHPAMQVSVLDVGTGPGLPAVPWAIALPNARVLAVDSVRKKTDTINDFIAKAKLHNLRATHARIETITEKHDIVTSRAFSSLKTFVTAAGQCVKSGGMMLALKGKVPHEEMAELAGTGWLVENVLPLRVPRLDAERCAVVLRHKN